MERILHEDGEGGKNHLEEDGASFLIWNDSRKSNGVDMRHKAKCDTAVIESRLRMVEYGMVATYRRAEHVGGPQQSYEVGAQVEVAPSGMRVG